MTPLRRASWIHGKRGVPNGNWCARQYGHSPSASHCRGASNRRGKSRGTGFGKCLTTGCTDDNRLWPEHISAKKISYVLGRILDRRIEIQPKVQLLQDAARWREQPLLFRGEQRLGLGLLTLLLDLAGEPHVLVKLAKILAFLQQSEKRKITYDIKVTTALTVAVFCRALHSLHALVDRIEIDGQAAGLVEPVQGLEHLSEGAFIEGWHAVVGIQIRNRGGPGVVRRVA